MTHGCADIKRAGVAAVTRPTYEATFGVSKTRMSTPANGSELVLACLMVHHSSYMDSRWVHDKLWIPPGDFECSEISSTPPHSGAHSSCFAQQLPLFVGPTSHTPISQRP